MQVAIKDTIILIVCNYKNDTDYKIVAMSLANHAQFALFGDT